MGEVCTGGSSAPVVPGVVEEPTSDPTDQHASSSDDGLSATLVGNHPAPFFFGTGGFVLVVDDEDDVRESMASILRGAGHAVATAATGWEAISILEELVVGILILDVRMPRFSGVDLLDTLASPPPTVIVSAESVDSGIRARLGEKVQRYMRKPFRPGDLLQAVSDAIGNAASAN
jgi:CheY-like chemotaxis protein